MYPDGIKAREGLRRGRDMVCSGTEHVVEGVMDAVRTGVNPAELEDVADSCREVEMTP